MKSIKPLQGIFTESGYASADFLQFLFLHIAGFGKEFICVTDQFFQHSFRQKILFRKRQLLLYDFCGGDAAPCMPFADPCVKFQIQMVFCGVFPDHLPADQTVL